MMTVSWEQYPNAKNGVVGKNFLGEWIERRARGGRLTSSQREAMGVSGLLTAAELRPRMENPKPPPPTHTGHFAFILLYFGYTLFFLFLPQDGTSRIGSPEFCSVAGTRMIWGGRPFPRGAS